MSDDASRFVGGPPPPPRKARGLTRASRPAIAVEPEPESIQAIESAPLPAQSTYEAESEQTAAVEPLVAQPVAGIPTAPVIPHPPVAEHQSAGVQRSAGEEFDAPEPRRHKIKVTFELDSDLRMRARTMFKLTGEDEGDVSFGGMLATLIENECIRRERVYNGGRPFEGTDRKLRPGRPLG